MSLYQRYLDYLNQAMPDISGIFRTTPTQAVEETTEETVAQPVGITPQLLQLTGGSGGDSFSVYNPDPTRTRTIKDYQFPFKFTGEDLPEAGDYIVPPRTGVMGLYDQYKALPTGAKIGLGATGLLTGGAIIPAALGVYGIGKGISSLLSPNRRSILENELLGAGVMLDDIGRVVAGPGSINTAENIMAGYNAAKITKETFDKRRRMIEENMKDPVQKAAKLKALDEAEKIYLGADDRAYDIYENKLDLTLPTGITDTTFQNFLAFKNLTEPKTGIDTIDKDDPIVDVDKAKTSIDQADARNIEAERIKDTYRQQQRQITSPGGGGYGDEGGTGPRRGASDIPDRNRGSYATDDTASFF
tara:strand:+ start:190 stop:1266 length:1077 start_codon:yes stop_codon:yes gene_type:complete